MFNSLIKISGKQLLLPLYHSVSDDAPAHIRNLYTIRSIENFNSDIDYILKYFVPIDVKTLINHIKNKEPLKKNSVLFTFDDGLSEVHDFIAPILKEKGIPAIFFINTDFVDNKDLFFRYKASLLIDKLKQSERISIDIIKILGVKSERKEEIISSILNIDFTNKSVLDKLANCLEFSFDEYLQAKKPYMSLIELKKLRDVGFAIGAHSINHPEYYKISFEEQIEQTITSMNWVKENFNQEFNLFAFPFTDFNVSKEFYDSVFKNDKIKLDLTFGCAGIKDDYHKFHLQRLPMEVGNKSANKVIVGEYQRYLLKKLIAKNRINRL